MADGGWGSSRSRLLSSRQVRVGEVTALVIVILDVDTNHLTEVYPQQAAVSIDVLAVQALQLHPTSGHALPLVLAKKRQERKVHR